MALAPQFLLLSLTRDGRVADPTALERIERWLPSATDCFVFCHGWLNDTAEARDGAAHFFGMLDGWIERLRAQVLPLRLALHWPSKPFADPELRCAGAHGGVWPELERISASARAESQVLSTAFHKYDDVF